MNRTLMLAAATVLAFSAAFAQALAGPLPARACSCMSPLPSLARVASEPGVVVLAGTVGQQMPDRTPIAVDTWFHGPGMTDVVWLNFGSHGMTSCDPFVVAGERRLLVLHVSDNGMYSYSPCVASGVIGTDAGDEALAEAIALFDAAPPPTASPTEPPAAPPPPTGADPIAGWLFVVGVVGAAALIFVGITLFALRRQPR